MALSDGNNGRAIGRSCLDWTQKGCGFALSRLNKKITRTAYATPVVPAADTRRHLQPPHNTRHVLLSTRVSSFSNLPCKPFHKTLPLPAQVWPLEDLLCRPASLDLVFGRLQQRTFGGLQHDLTFRIYLFSHTTPPPLWMTSTQFDLRETNVTIFTFCLTVYLC